MKGNPDVIKVLNEVLRKELTGINQYFIHAKMCRNWGYEVLAEHARKESIDEMKHADELIERILFLEGVPNISAYDKILVGSSVKQQLENDLALEQAALTVLKPGIKTCLDAHDDASRELLEHIIVDEEQHIDWLETQQHQIKEIGYENYLAQQIHKKSNNRPASAAKVGSEAEWFSATPRCRPFVSPSPVRGRCNPWVCSPLVLDRALLQILRQVSILWAARAQYTLAIADSMDRSWRIAKIK